MTTHRPTRILAVSSGGGHWVQLMRLRGVLDDCSTTYATVRREYAADLNGERLFVIQDATRWNKLRLAVMCCQLILILIRVRPQVVISTGAAPGYFAIRFAKLFRARTIWLDSIANIDDVSMTGHLVDRHADLMLTQWEHLQGSLGNGRPQCVGAVL